jgi:hypothetical protein
MQASHGTFTMRDERGTFYGRTAVLGTKHGKERAIAPVLDEHLGIHVSVPEDFDSDRYGTFTREVDRAGDQLEAARQKARAAMNQTGDALGLASEGSFGPHPTVGLLPVNLELVVLIDRRHGIEVVGKNISPHVVMAHETVRSVDEALRWAERAGFPEHGLVVRRGPDDARGMTKGIASEAALVEAVEQLLRKPFVRSVFIETDLRAHMNPTRMDAIREAAIDLVENAQRRCPACDRPGFSVDEARPGLPCAGCGLPTNATLSHVYCCNHCGYATERRYPAGHEAADPGQCPFCNP